jgi:GT2 family glycosyltransferase
MRGGFWCGDMHVFAVLVNWRNTARTIQCAAELRRWDTLKPTIIIVDNESTEDSRRALSDAGVADTIVLSTTNRGYAGGNNLGISAVARDTEAAILLLNSDVQISEAAVSQLVGRLEADRALSIVGPLLAERGNGRERCYVGGRDIARHPRTRIEVDAAHLTALASSPLLPVDYVPGTVFLARGSLFDEIGVLDEDYFFSGEIADFCRRARATNHQLRIDALAKALHETDDESSSLRGTLHVYYSLRNRFLYVRRHHAAEKLRYFGLWLMIAGWGAAGAVVRGRFGRARAIVLATIHGIMGRYGNQNAEFI